MRNILAPKGYEKPDQHKVWRKQEEDLNYLLK
jgi:hypothetical protein